MHTLPRPEPDYGDLIVWGCMGTACAAAAYPLLAILLSVTLQGDWLEFLTAQPESIVLLAMGGVLGGLLATVVTGFVAGWLALVVNLIRWSIGWQPSPIVVATFTGGLTGFVYGMTSTTWYQTQWQDYVVGPGLATIVGQLGGAYGAVRMSGVRVLPEADFGRISLRQLLILTAWGAGLLGVAKGLGVLTPNNAAIVGGWLVMQSITSFVIVRLSGTLMARP